MEKKAEAWQKYNEAAVLQIMAPLLPEIARAMAEPLTPPEEKLLVARSEEIRPLYCRMCYQCTGQCPKGVPVTDELRFLAYNDFYGDFHQAQRNFMTLAREVRNVRCSDCSTCAVECPNGVHAHERLIRAQELLA